METRYFFIKNKPILWLLLPALTAFVVVMPLLLNNGIPFGNDASFHLSRIVSLYEGLRNNILLPGVYADYFNGFGYGNGLFYPDIFLYIPAALMFFGLSSITAYKLFLVFLTAAMAASMFCSVKSVFKSDFGAAVSSALYLLSSFHTTDLYQRSSVGELLAFVFLPMIIAGFWQVVCGDDKKWPLLCAGFSGLVLSHVLSAVIMGALSAVFLLVCFNRLRLESGRLMAFGKAVLWSLIFTLFFLVPMIEQLALNPVWGDTGLLGDIADWAVPFKQLVFAIPQLLGEKYVPPAGIGLVLLVLAAAGVFFGRKDKRVLLLVLSGFVLLFVASVYFPWRLLGTGLSTLQFPWRFYLFTTVFWCFAAGRIIEILPLRREGQALTALLAAAVMLISFAVNVAYIYKNYAAMVVNTYPTFAAGCEYLPEDVTLSHLQESQKNWKNNVKRTDYNVYEIDLERNGSIELPLIYYAGYEATLNGQPVSLRRSPDGMAEIETEETGTLVVQYAGTRIRRVCEAGTLLGIIIGAALLIKNRGKEKGRHDRKILSSE